MNIEEQRHRLAREFEELTAGGVPEDPEAAQRLALVEQQLRATRPCDDRCCRPWEPSRN